MASRRLNVLREALSEKGLAGAAVFNPENIFYLVGVSAGVLYVTDSGATIIVADIDYEETREKVSGAEVVKTDFGELPAERLRKIIPEGRTIGYEEGYVNVGLYEDLRKDIALRPLQGTIEKMREVKDADEISRIEEAQRVTERALQKTLGSISRDMSELEVAAEVEANMRRAGAEAFAFETLVASGPSAVYPHGKPAAKRIEEGSAVVIDVGSRVRGYCSDMTRTIFFGQPSAEFVKIYRAVLEAQTAALDFLRAGVTGRDVDAVARDVLRGRGYGSYFSHGLGHGVGINVHEPPSLNSRGRSALVPGNVLTVEPGAYVPKLGGVRIEDLVVVTAGGCRNLTGFSKEMIVI